MIVLGILMLIAAIAWYFVTCENCDKDYDEHDWGILNERNTKKEDKV